MQPIQQCDFATHPMRVVGLTVRFVDGAPTDEAIDAAHVCIGRANLTPPMTLRVHWADPGRSIRSLRLVLAGGEEIHAGGPELLPALHELCAHAASFQLASQEDRLRWRRAMVRSSHSSGLYAAV